MSVTCSNIARIQVYGSRILHVNVWVGADPDL